MAISQNQIVDYLNKKVGYGVAKTDLYTAKQPYNESIASPLLVPGATVLQQDYAIPNVSSAPSANTVVNGGTVVSVYNTSTSAVVQGTSLSESETNETWSTGLTNWIPPSFGSGYQLKIYAGPPGASAATAAQYTNLPVAGTGASDSWFFDYQSGVLNFADTIVPTAAANVSNVVYFMGAVYTGTLGITNYANLAVTGNLTSINGNIVLTNGNVYAQNYYGVFQGTIGSGVTASQSNVAYYDQITNLSNNQTYYLEFANLVAGNSITGAVSTVNVNPSTGTLSATAFSGTTGTLGGTLSVTGATTLTTATTGGLQAVAIGNVTPGTGAFTTGTFSSTLGVTGALTFTTATGGGLQAVAIGNVTPGTAVFTTATTGGLQAVAIGNVTPGLGFFTTANATNLYAATIGNAGAVITGTSGIFTQLNSTYSNPTNLASANAVITGGSVNGTPIGATTASSGAFTTLSATNVTQLTNSTQASSTTTGALQVTGGISTQANLYVGGNTTIIGNLTVVGTTTSVNSEIINQTEVVAGTLTANSSASSTSFTSGQALLVSGGAGVVGAAYIGGGVQNSPIGNATPNTGNFTTLNATTSITTATINAATIGNIGANVNGTGTYLTALNASNLSSGTVPSAQISGSYTGITQVGTLTGNTVVNNTLYAQGVYDNGTRVVSTSSGAGNLTISGSSIVLTATGPGATTVGSNTQIPVITTDAYGRVVALTSQTILTSFTVGNTTGTTTTVAGASTLTLAGTYGVTVNIGNEYANIATPQDLRITANPTFNNLVTASVQGVIGNVTPAPATFTTITTQTESVGGLQAVAIGNVTPGTAVFTTQTTDGLQAVAIGNVTPGTGAFTSLNSSTTAVLNTITGASFQGIIGNVTPATGTFTSVTAQTESVGGLQAVAIGNVTPGLGFFTTANATNVYAATVGNVGTTLYGVGTNITGAIPTANVALYDQITNLTNNQVYYLEFANVVSGNSITGAVTSVNVNPSTGTLSASLFVGNAAGLTNIPIGAISGTYPTANVAIYEQLTNSTTNATFYVPFYDKATGNALAYTNTSLNFNPSNGTLVASTYYGAGTGLTGNASSLSVGYASSAGSAGTSGYATYAGQISMSGEPSGTTYLTTVNSNSGQQNLYAPGGATWVESTGTIGASAFQACNTVIVGSLNYTPSQALVQVGTNTNGFTQIVNQNQSNGNNASADIAAVANNGSDNDTYTDMGIVSSTYNQAAYSLYKPNDGYLIVAGNTTTGGGNLILNTYQKNDIIFATGGTFANAEVARFRGNTITNGNLTIKLTTPNSLSANTGAFQLWGGASISGNAYIGGSSYQMGGALFNHNQASAGTSGSANQNAFIMQGVNDSTLIYAKPLTAYDAVIIGGNAASSSFAQGAKFIVNSADSMILPVGTSAQRPGSSGGTDTTGMFRYSSTLGSIEWYNGTTWSSASTSFTVIADQQFTGTGSQTAFTLSSSQTTASCIVSINGVVQIPTLAYSVSGTTLTFTEAPLTTDVIDVRMLTTTQTVTQLYDTSGYNTVNTITGTGVTITTGTSALTTQYTFDTNGGFVTNGSNVTIASAGTSVIDNLFANSYSSAKYTITATIQDTTIREVTEVLMVHTGNGAGAGSVYMSSYGRVNTAGNTLVTYSGATSGNIAQLQATTTNANTILRIKRDYMAI